MRRKSRKHRKTAHRRLGDTPGCDGKNGFGNSVSSKGELEDCRVKLKNSVIHGGGVDSKIILADFEERSNCKQPHRLPKKKKSKSLNVDWYESNRSLTFPSTTVTSIAFFIPLNTCVSAMAFENTLRWNDLLYYESNTSAFLMQYRSEQEKRNLYNSCLAHQPLMKCRSSSESSANSEDSVVLFESDDNFLEDARVCDKANSVIDTAVCSSTMPSSVPEKANLTSKSQKRVRFVDNAELVTVHLIIAWDYAYRAARISPWEIVARDTNRFKSKIQSLEPILNPILESDHRQKIWNTRIRQEYSDQ